MRPLRGVVSASSTAIRGRAWLWVFGHYFLSYGALDVYFRGFLMSFRVFHGQVRSYSRYVVRCFILGVVYRQFLILFLGGMVNGRYSSPYAAFAYYLRGVGQYVSYSYGSSLSGAFYLGRSTVSRRSVRYGVFFFRGSVRSYLRHSGEDVGVRSRGIYGVGFTIEFAGRRQSSFIGSYGVLS